MWEPIEIQYHSVNNHADDLKKVIEGRNPAIINRNFYNVKACNIINKRIRKVSCYNYGSGVIKKIGTSLLVYLNKKSKYFTDAKKSKKRLEKIFKDLDDPLMKIQNTISSFFPSKVVEVAKEGEKLYSCGIIRVHETGDYAPLHRDNVRFEAPEFYVSSYKHQLSCVLYVQIPESGGELILYRQSWKRPNERFREIGFGYSPKVLSDDVEATIIRPRTGDLVIINPNYFHEIRPVTGKIRRITFGTFVAFSDNMNNVVTWA